MSAESLGKILLEEVKEERLDELLFSLRCLEPPTSTLTGLLAVDQLLDIFQDSRRAGQQQSHANRFGLNLSSQNPCHVKELTPPVLEITSFSQCSGKTQLLYLIITIALLPQSYNDIPFNGNSSAVILLGLSNKFSILRLRNVVASYIDSCVSACNSIALSPVDISSLIQNSLVHLHVFRPQSSSSLLETISSLPSYFLSLSASHPSAGRRISSLILDDLSAFLWQDRLADTNSMTAANERSSGGSHFIQNYRMLVSSLKSIQSTFSCVIIATNSSFSTPCYLSGNRLALRRQTPKAWNTFCTAQIVIERIKVPKFGPGISIQEAEDERTKRQEVVKRGERRGWVNWWGSEDWREEVKEGLQNWEKQWEFLRFSISEGVMINLQEKK